MIFSSFRWNHQTTLELKNATRAYVYYRSKRVNLLTGFPETFPLIRFLNTLEEYKLQDEFPEPTVFHFTFDLGLLLQGLGHSVGEDTVLAIEICYRDHQFKDIKSSRLKLLPLEHLERPTWSEYKIAFANIQEELLLGNCYQVNLTYPYDFQTEDVIDPRDLNDFFFSRKGLGGFAHSTFIGEEMILSNSPECLFHFKKNRFVTLPIKGTVKRGRNWKKDWKNLSSDKKQEGELFMIIDLLKNDLNKMESPSTQVEKLKAPLLVPGLLHQYALLSVQIERELSFHKVLQSIFPGGSVTGAPKKRVMEIIQKVERFERGHYCGSTLLCWKDNKWASINIRTASISPMDRTWRYGAGGGITLLSRPVDEFQEMESKVKSFLTLLKVPGY